MARVKVFREGSDLSHTIEIPSDYGFVDVCKKIAEEFGVTLEGYTPMLITVAIDGHQIPTGIKTAKQWDWWWKDVDHSSSSLCTEGLRLYRKPILSSPAAQSTALHDTPNSIDASTNTSNLRLTSISLAPSTTIPKPGETSSQSSSRSTSRHRPPTSALQTSHPLPQLGPKTFGYSDADIQEMLSAEPPPKRFRWTMASAQEAAETLRLRRIISEAHSSRSGINLSELIGEKSARSLAKKLKKPPVATEEERRKLLEEVAAISEKAKKNSNKYINSQGGL